MMAVHDPAEDRRRELERLKKKRVSSHNDKHKASVEKKKKKMERK